MAIQTRKIFLDSSIFVAFVDRSDPNHLKASKAIEDLARLGYQVYTSIQNVQDSYAVLAREVGVTLALEFLQAMLQSDTEIIFPQKADLITAHRMLRSNRDRQITLREVVNATLMQRRGIIQLLTFTYWHNLFGTYVSGLVTQ